MRESEKENLIYLDVDRYLDLDRFFYMKNGFPIYFSKTQFLILKCLCKNLNKAVSAEEIIHYTWGNYGAIETQHLYVCINRIRKKLEDQDGRSKYLFSVRGFGYLLHSYVKSLEEVTDSGK